ncbi:uncharacterized protein Z520_01897 [Fonsecaea multimorphosa CBS 102226]|uniref:MT-A70-domain-containing protein n=1 Tax=Fonsecaea multimorphosa CBS 102226 TaxID=1442371 RepID=A0A0D2KY49_9EURO|nr:uncharacterized protein Z520_01897 [Fonsecaea multimorphosa CBS 102226]KIY01759.1 hypothetical protein Z520_01897 [Fonsecaea multimorphosa CBS 102226]OAL29953.1 hypothetical protein AYO22_01859 [Fonsecaea multimorphosa]
MSGAILYRNQAATVVLIDVPQSIRDAQQVPYTLRSSPALNSPYPSTEPKGSKREAVLNTTTMGEQHYHESVQREIHAALIEIRTQLHGQGGVWCHPRHALTSHHDSTSPSPAQTSIPEWSVSTDWFSTGVPVVLSTTERRNKFRALDDLHGTIVYNIRSETAIVEVGGLGDFIVPSGSSFILASLERGFPSFLSARHALSPEKKNLELILMDPPWPNRSVRNSNAYRTSEAQAKDPFLQAVGIARDFLAPEGLLAIWITNKSSIRARVLQTMQTTDLHLHEEWIWIKITSQGVPVSQLDGVWRRPYEILLLFRKGQPLQDPVRKIVASVPDLHSRKPCLKVLLEEQLPPKYSALELFARNLTAGWWSWGDEVLKFQHESQWYDYGRSEEGC